MTNGSIQVEGLDQLIKRFGNLPKEVQRACMKGMAAGAMEIIADAKENLRKNDSIAFGHLEASGKVQKVDDATLDAGFFVKDKTTGYAYYVEYGRKSGKFPPVDEIVEWLKKKTAVAKGMKSAFDSAAAFARTKPETYRKQIAFLIARSIAKNGTRPHPFLTPAIESGWGKMMSKIQSIANSMMP